MKPIRWLCFWLLIPLTLVLGSFLPGRSYYLVGTLVLAEVMLPFFLSFEGRKPAARELVVLAVLCALAVAARAAIPIPNFRAIFAVIILAGIAFGGESGFLVGAVSAFVSNFFFGHGPYTPWQMAAFGLCGLLAGIAFRPRRLRRSPVAMALFGFCTVVLLVGPLLDTCTLFLASSSVTPQAALLVYAAGLPINLGQGLCTALVLLVLGRPMLDKLERLQRKFGMMEAQDGT